MIVGVGAESLIDGQSPRPGEAKGEISNNKYN